MYMIHFRQLSSFPPLYYFPMFSCFFPLFACFRFPSSSVSLLLFDLFCLLLFPVLLIPSCHFFFPFQTFYLSSHCFILCLVFVLSFHLLCTFSVFCTSVSHTSSHSSPPYLLFAYFSFDWSIGMLSNSFRYTKRYLCVICGIKRVCSIDTQGFLFVCDEFWFF
jgi:hypothetical protein